MHRHTCRCGSCVCTVPAGGGPAPYAVNVNETARQNGVFRSALWTGCHLQMTLMSIPAGGDVGAEIHPDTDQYIRVEAGQGVVMTGCCAERLDTRQRLGPNGAVFIPAGLWHNLVNTGGCPLKLSSVYAPPHHPLGTLHATKQDAEKSEY